MSFFNSTSSLNKLRWLCGILSITLSPDDGIRYEVDIDFS